MYGIVSVILKVFKLAVIFFSFFIRLKKEIIFRCFYCFKISSSQIAKRISAHVAL